MVGRQDRKLAVLPHHRLKLPVNGADDRFRKEVRQRRPPQRHDQLRPDQPDLLVDPRSVRADLRRLRRPVPRRPTRHDVRNVHSRPLEARLLEQPVQVAARTARERPAGLVFLRSRRLSDQQHLRPARSRARHDLRPPRRQRAACTAAHRRVERPQTPGTGHHLRHSRHHPRRILFPFPARCVHGSPFQDFPQHLFLLRRPYTLRGQVMPGISTQPANHYRTAS